MNGQTRTWLMLVSAAVVAMVCQTGAALEPAPAADPPKQAEPAKTGKPAESKPAESRPADAKPAEGDNKTEPKKEEPVPAEPKVYYVKMTTSKGDLIVELNNEKAPISTKNFLSYVDKKFYDGTIFHRVIPGFMIQGGGFTADMKQKTPDSPIKNEWRNGLKNLRGTLSMARTQVADSATSQFFINVVDNAGLDQARDGAAYAVFGRIVAGMDVADKIVAVPTGNKGMHQNVPNDPITINSVTRMTDADAAPFLKSEAPKTEPVSPAKK